MRLDMEFNPLRINAISSLDQLLENTARKKEEMLVMKIFSFSHNIFHLFKKKKKKIKCESHLQWGLQMFLIWARLKFCFLLKS